MSSLCSSILSVKIFTADRNLEIWQIELATLNCEDKCLYLVMF